MRELDDMDIIKLIHRIKDVELILWEDKYAWHIFTQTSPKEGRGDWNEYIKTGKLTS